MSIIGRDANKNKKCFAACQPGTYCECLGKTIEEKDCGFSDISCILQHMSSVAKSEELVGNLQIAGDIECWVDQIRQLNTTTRPPVAGLAELTDAQAIGLYDAMNKASALFMKQPNPIQGWPTEHDKAIAAAAREFLGKVDG